MEFDGNAVIKYLAAELAAQALKAAEWYSASEFQKARADKLQAELDELKAKQPADEKV